MHTLVPKWCKCWIWYVIDSKLTALDWLEQSLRQQQKRITVRVRYCDNNSVTIIWTYVYFTFNYFLSPALFAVCLSILLRYNIISCIQNWISIQVCTLYKHTYMHIVVACCFCLSTASVWWHVCVRTTKKRKGTDHHVQET